MPAASGAESDRRRPFSEEAIRLTRLLLRLFQTEPEIMGLLALMLLQHSRAAARLDADGLEAAQTDRAAFIALVRREHAFWGEKLKTLNVKFE